MKRYEKMSREQIIEEAVKCLSLDCVQCDHRDCKFGMLRSECFHNYLYTEIKQVPRWQTAKTQEEFNMLKDEFQKLCDKINSCSNCKYRFRSVTYHCYHDYLSELVEVEE